MMQRASMRGDANTRVKKLRFLPEQAMGRRTLAMMLLAFTCAATLQAQDSAKALAEVSPPSSDAALARGLATEPSPVETLALTVPKGTPLQVVLDAEVRLKKAGQPIHGRVVEPVYAFDKVVIPAGSEMNGRIARIHPVSALGRTVSALDADFSPARKIDVEFTEVVLPDGKRVPVAATVTSGSGQVIQFVSASGDPKAKKGLKDKAGDKEQEAKKQARQRWDSALRQVKAPGKIHRIERYAIAQLPVHPQYIDAGTAYFAELRQSLDFGTEPLTPELASSIGAAPPEGSIVHARLVTPLSSATAQKGDDVEAVVSQPLFDGGKLIVPQGALLKGDVVQVSPAHRLGRNGRLRCVFHELVLPNGIQQKVDAILSGVEAGKADRLKLDSEGGAQATSPKSRYLKTAISMGMAMVSAGGDGDARVPNPAGNSSNRMIGGAGGFKLVGMVMGAAVKSRAFGYSMGAYGAGMSVYTHFIARGRDVVFSKGTAMDIGVATRSKGASRPSSAAPDDPSRAP